VSQRAILAALAKGPATTAQLAEQLHQPSAYIARDCAKLIEAGRAKRIDGGAGRGGKAVYALAEFDGEAIRADQILTTVALPRRKTEGAVGSSEHLTFVSRDPCPRCGVRGDLGCRHSLPIGRAPFLVGEARSGRTAGQAPAVGASDAGAASSSPVHAAEVAHA